MSLFRVIGAAVLGSQLPGSAVACCPILTPMFANSSV